MEDAQDQDVEKGGEAKVLDGRVVFDGEVFVDVSVRVLEQKLVHLTSYRWTEAILHHFVLSTHQILEVMQCRCYQKEVLQQ